MCGRCRLYEAQLKETFNSTGKGEAVDMSIRQPELSKVKAKQV